MIYEEYVSEKKIKDVNEEEEKREIIVNIIKTKIELENNRKNFEFAEAELIDYYLYQIKANQSKLNYLIKKSKANGITIDRLKQIELKNNERYDVV